MEDAIIGTEVMPTQRAREIFRIVPTEHGFDVQIAEGVTMTQAATVFISAVSKQLGKRLPNTWIPAAYELPERNVWVLVCGPHWRWAGVGQWDGASWQQDAGQVIDNLTVEGVDLRGKNLDCEPYSNVSHWMPLPDVVKEGR